MPRQWTVKKNSDWMFVLVYSVVGMALLMSFLAFALSSAR